MYPITKQIIKFNSENNKKIGMLILDVKGNYYEYVKKQAYIYNRKNDLIVLELGGDYTYNPLDKTNLKPRYYCK